MLLRSFFLLYNQPHPQEIITPVS